MKTYKAITINGEQYIEQYSEEDENGNIIWIDFPFNGYIADSDTRRVAILKAKDTPDQGTPSNSEEGEQPVKEDYQKLLYNSLRVIWTTLHDSVIMKKSPLKDRELANWVRRSNVLLSDYENHISTPSPQEGEQEREEKDHFYKLIGYIGNQMLNPDKVGHELYAEFKQQGYTLTKK